MYVCLCNAITDREIRGAVTLGARSVEDLKSMLGVATCCGRCEDCAAELVDNIFAQEPQCAGLAD